MNIAVEPTTLIVEPKKEFTGLSESEVIAALRDPDPTNKIAVEVARLCAGYGKNFTPMFERRILHVPADIPPAPRSPIEAVAMAMTINTTRDEFRRTLKRDGDDR